MKLIYLLLVILSVAPGYSQQPISQTNNSGDWFDQIIGIENAGIISGSQYKMKIVANSSDPFFQSAETGTIRYRHNRFQVSLLYDIYQDEIVVKHQNAASGIWLVQLNKNVVQEFTIGTHLFKNFDGGFYEVMFEGTHFQVLSKRSKMTQVSRGSINYVVVNRFYLVQSGNWKPLPNITSFSRILDSKDMRSEFKLFLRRNHIKARKFQDEELVEVATFVNDLLER